MDITNSVIGFVKDFGSTVWKYVEYQICPKDYVREFEAIQKKLEDRLKDVEAELKTQLNELGKKARNEVDTWREKARKESAVKVEDLVYKGGCFTFICSSRRLDKKTQALNEGIFNPGEKYTNAGKSLVVEDHSKKGVPQLVEKCIAWDDVQEEILQLLREDKVTRIAVCGMGGVGKTTIMKQVHNQLLKEPKFNKVIWVKASKDFDIVVQQKKQFDILEFQTSIVRKLGFGLKNEEQDEIEVAGQISEDVGIPSLVGSTGCKVVLTTRLQQNVARAMECEVIQVKPLLDDEALALFLDKVGSTVLSHPRFKSDIEPFFKQILKKCNGLPLAIRVVAKTMRGKFDHYSWEIADRELSKSKEIIDCLKFSYDHLEEQYKKHFLYCALYPEDHEISKEELIEFWIEEGFIIDERGSRHLMICEGHVILVNLLDNCMLELVKNKHKADWLSLQELVGNKNKEDRVSMHDLLREMALNINPQFMVKAGMALEELPEEHEWREDLLKVSLMNNHIREIPSSMLSPKCPMLTTLLLSNNNIITIPEAFFDQMLGLKILDLSNNEHLGRLPSSVSKLENLTTLLLENCKSLKEIPFLSNLRGLKKLNLFGTSIEELPEGLNMLTNLKYLWLGDRSPDIPNGLLQNLSKLQYLGVDWSIPLKWEEIQGLRKLESFDGRFSTVEDMSLFVKSERKFSNGDCKDVRSLNGISTFQVATNLQHCTIDECDGLEFVVSSSCLKPLQKLESLYLYYLDNLNAVFGEVGAVTKSAPLPAGTFCSLQKIKVEECGKIKKLLPLRLLRCLQNLQTIKVMHCYEMDEIIWSEYEEGEEALEKLTLPKLEMLVLVGLSALKGIYNGSSTVLICDSMKRVEIRSCDKIESVFWSGFNPLPTLEYLKLWCLGNLKTVFNEEALGLSIPPTTSFSLKTNIVCGCPKLKKLFSSRWLLGYFQSLENIEVEGCNQMKELISSSTDEEKEALEKITLPNLQRLKLKFLLELSSICNSSSVLISDSIKSLEIGGCGKLKRIPLHLSSLDKGQPSSLKQIQVDTKECWESLEWDQSNAKDVLLPSVNFVW
ncbi:hypothetical protein SLEP1_g46278 [Rubroshorea leprosula]|uniref:NB-ARC domain-containing protein n=1 Tax=Rubroshorea leprosula TaxID=152421 RepID=A0AAV5LP53_9ROSI|nr:hypothetical protein SLEP1_g46278 [Rubroshorea leprosula]